MSNLIDKVGEREEFGERDTVPESSYIATMTIGDIDCFDKKDPDTGEVVEEKGGDPYVELTASIEEGPFTGIAPEARYNLGFGREDKKGGVIPLKLGACKTLSGQSANEVVLKEFGWVDPVQEAGEDDFEYGARLRNAMKEFYFGLTAMQRLDFATRFLRVAGWDGRKVVVVTTLTPNKRREGQFFVNFDGFYALNHPKRGEEYVRKVCHPKQAALLEGA